MSDEVLRLRGVEVRRDAAVLLRNVDWTAHENERWILIGPNGAGKTTLLQVAATMVFPSAGTVDVLGQRLSPRVVGQPGRDGRHRCRGVGRPGIGGCAVEQTERGHAGTARAQHGGGEGGAEGPPAQGRAPVASRVQRV